VNICQSWGRYEPGPISIYPAGVCCIFFDRNSIDMRACGRFACLLLLSLSALGQSTPSMVPERVQFPADEVGFVRSSHLELDNR
jgi:hypothetical protein